MTEQEAKHVEDAIRQVCAEEALARCTYPLCRCRTVPRLAHAMARHYRGGSKPFAKDSFA